MPAWAVILLSVLGALVLVAAGAVGGVLGWRAYTRRLVLRFVARAEAIEAAGQALVETVSRLAHGEDGELHEFAEDPESSERRALHEVATRAHMLAYELDHMPLPRALIDVAEALADAAVVIDREASRVQDPHTGGAALDALSQIDLEAVKAYTRHARELLGTECTARGLNDMAVYGGGLYL